jgi:hypothetical protein
MQKAAKAESSVGQQDNCPEEALAEIRRGIKAEPGSQATY